MAFDRAEQKDEVKCLLLLIIKGKNKQKYLDIFVEGDKRAASEI